MLAKRRKILYLLSGLACGCAVAPPQVPNTPATVVPSPTSVKPDPVRPFPRELIFSTVKKWTDGFSGTSGVACGPSAHPLEVAHQADLAFEAASLVKLPILVELGRRLEAGQHKSDDRLVFEERFRVGGSGVLKDRQAGGEYTLDQLALWMVTESDNVATDMLLEHLGMAEIEKEMTRLGLSHTTVQRKVFAFEEIERGRDNRISAGDAAILLGRMVQGKLPRSQWMLDILCKTRRRDLICAKLPKDLKVAHKTGELTGFLHDAAVVYTSQPFVLVICTQGEKADSQKFIQGLSQAVYQALA